MMISFPVKGDEFVILLKNLVTRKDLQEAAARINRIIAEPIRLNGNEYVLSASIGMSIFPDHGYEAEGLIQKADHAMYLAKESGGGIQAYEVGMAKRLSRKLLLEQYLHKAIEKMNYTWNINRLLMFMEKRRSA